MHIKAIIIEDEKNSLKVLNNMLTNFCEGVEVVAWATSVQEGVAAIQDHRPQLVFLDVEMPQQNGFMLFDYFKEPEFYVIFTTAYDQYAVKAFRYAALDYLLKPINLEHLRKAILRINEQSIKQLPKQKLSVLKENLNALPKRIILPTNKGYSIVTLSEIIFCEANRNYTLFYFSNNKKLLVSKTLRIYTELLTESSFFRINRSHLVNLQHVIQFGRQKKPVLELSSGHQLNLSESRRNAFFEIIHDFI